MWVYLEDRDECINLDKISAVMVEKVGDDQADILFYGVDGDAFDSYCADRETTKWRIEQIYNGLKNGEVAVRI